MAVQTPQVFRYSIIRQAHEKARLGRMDGVTDDSMLVEKYGDCKVKMVEGSYKTKDNNDGGSVCCGSYTEGK